MLALVVISPATTTRPVVTSVSTGLVVVENGIRDLIGDLVRVSLGDRFRGEEMSSVTAHAVLLG